jgi:hypothetical protein
LTVITLASFTAIALPGAASASNGNSEEAKLLPGDMVVCLAMGHCPELPPVEWCREGNESNDCLVAEPCEAWGLTEDCLRPGDSDICDVGYLPWEWGWEPGAEPEYPGDWDKDSSWPWHGDDAEGPTEWNEPDWAPDEADEYGWDGSDLQGDHESPDEGDDSSLPGLYPHPGSEPCPVGSMTWERASPKPKPAKAKAKAKSRKKAKAKKKAKTKAKKAKAKKKAKAGR